MFYIADNNSFNTLKLLCNEKALKNSSTEENFWLSLKADVMKMIKRDINFDKIPYHYRYEAIEEISQDVILDVLKKINSFIINPSSWLPGSRTNWLKVIVHNKLCDYLKHNQQFFNSTLSIEQDTYREVPLEEVIEDTNKPKITKDDVYFFTRFYVFFTDYKFRIKSKIMYFNKQLMIEVEKRGKNGGISGKHNCLTELYGKSLFELGDKVVEYLDSFVKFDIPEKYIMEIDESINLDLYELKNGRYVGDEVFDMKYSHAASESSRINGEFKIYDDKIKILANKFYDEFETIETLMSR